MTIHSVDSVVGQVQVGQALQRAVLAESEVLDISKAIGSEVKADQAAAERAEQALGQPGQTWIATDLQTPEASRGAVCKRLSPAAAAAELGSRASARSYATRAPSGSPVSRCRSP